MNLERRHTYHVRSLHANSLTSKAACARIDDIVNGPDFYLLTTLAWIRVVPCTNTYRNAGVEVDGSRESPAGGLQSDMGLLPFHRDRLATAAEAMGWRHLDIIDRSEGVLELLRSKLLAHLAGLPHLQDGQTESRKIRILVSKKGHIDIDSTVMKPAVNGHQLFFKPHIPSTLNPAILMNTQECEVFVDTQPTCDSLFTTHKTSHRPHYNAARTRAQITTAPTEKEVLLYNKHGEIMEGSLSTVYLHRDGKWITPAAVCGCTLGVTRRLALENGLCKQGLIEVGDLGDGEKIWLSNAARGFFVGRIVLGHDSFPLIATPPDLL